MKFKQSARLAFKSMLASKMRSFLTMLGIIIGVSAVIILVSLVNGFSKSMTDSFASMGTNLITVSTNRFGSSIPVSVKDMLVFVAENDELISYVSPSVNAAGTVKKGSASVNGTISGVSEDYRYIKNYTLQAGRFINYIDCYGRNKVCVLGSNTSSELQLAVGDTVKIKGDAYTVIGIIEEKAAAADVFAASYTVLMPYTTATLLAGSKDITSYYFSAASDQAVEKIEAYLYSAYGGKDDYFYVSNQSDMVEQVNELTGTLTLVLVCIAGISLLVGGIGIMNIMLVSVTERTREIGIRKSLGGRRRDIMRQFLIEAAVTSGLGGVFGIVFGIVIALLVASVMELPKTVSLSSCLLAFFVSVGIGVLFGYMPANRAAALNPIDALRYD